MYRHHIISETIGWVVIIKATSFSVCCRIVLNRLLTFFLGVTEVNLIEKLDSMSQTEH